MFLSEDEKNVLNWLKFYGPLTRNQLVKLLNKDNPKVVDGIFRKLRNSRLIESISGGYYIGLNKSDKFNPKVVEAMWVFLYFSKDVLPTHHRAGDFPSQIYFLKDDSEYEIIVIEKGLEHELTLITDENPERKYIIVIPSLKNKDLCMPYLPKHPCVFASLTYDGVSTEPMVRFALPDEEVEEDA